MTNKRLPTDDEIKRFESAGCCCGTDLIAQQNARKCEEPLKWLWEYKAHTIRADHAPGSLIHQTFLFCAVHGDPAPSEG